MIAVLLGAGTGLLLAGLAAIVYGMPIKEFSFGSTMILAGVVAACSGAIMLGLFVVARQLQNIALGLGGGIAVAPHGEPALGPTAALRGQPGDSGDFLFSRDQPPGEGAGAAGREGTSSQDGGAAEAPPAPQPAEAAPPLKPRRNLLFSSSSRKERERAAARTSEPLAPDLLSPDLRPPPSEVPPASEPAEPSPATFEDAWPKPERGRPREAPLPPPRRGGRSPSSFADAPAGAANRDAPSQVTVLKSGVVDGMAYSLYSDGSIEAQMPEGMMRFASIDELRAHLDHRP
jgi:hypothetical protein